MLYDDVGDFLKGAERQGHSVLLHGTEAPFALRAAHPLKVLDLSEMDWRQAQEKVLMWPDNEPLILDRLDGLLSTRSVKEAILKRAQDGLRIVASANSVETVRGWFGGALYLKFDEVHRVKVKTRLDTGTINPRS